MNTDRQEMEKVDLQPQDLKALQQAADITAATEKGRAAAAELAAQKKALAAAQRQRMSSRAHRRNRLIKASAAGTKVVKRATQLLGVRDGDVLLIKAGTPLADEVGINEIAAAFSRTARRQCIVLVVDDFDDLSVADEDAMRTHGWVRVSDDEQEAVDGVQSNTRPQPEG